MDVVLKGLHTVKAKGKTYVYAYRSGPRVLAKPGTAAFLQEVALARAARTEVDRSKFAGLCRLYRASDEFKRLAPKTKANWTPWLDRVQKEFGDMRVGAFDHPRIVQAIRTWRSAYKATPRAADMGLQVLSRVLSFGGEEGLLATNAASKVARLYSANRSDIIWTAEDLAELAKHASPEIMRAARLAALTGLRQGDLLRLSWSHVGEHAIEVRTAKTGRSASIPLYGELRTLLGEIPKKSTIILTSTKGRPWKTGFGASWQEAVKAAKIDKHFHDLRGTAATRLYLADFSIREIAQMMAWGEDHVERLIDRYVKRDELLKDRIRRLDQNARRTNSVKLGVKPRSGK